MPLTPLELERYSRQLKLEQVGVTGQLKLKETRVLCVGAGGLGSSLLLYLAAAGIGTLGIIDDDSLERSNLQRQVLYREAALGAKKALLAKQQLLALNPGLQVHAYTERLSLQNAPALFKHYDLIADCSDNFATRYLVNDVAYKLDKPYVFACVSQFEGQCALFLGKKTPCFRCLFPIFPDTGLFPSCEEGGVVGVLPGLLGILQANEIIKWTLGLPQTLAGKLLTLDLLSMEFHQLSLRQNSDCALCVRHTVLESLATTPPCSIVVNQDAYAISMSELEELRQKKKNLVLVDVRTAPEHQLSNLGGRLLPLSQLAKRLNELDREQIIVVYCQSGARSIQAVDLLVKAQFRFVRYLQGGLLKSVLS